MRRIALSLAATLAFGLCALAQQKPPNDPQSAPPGTNPSTMPSAQTPDTSSSPQTGASEKGEKKLKGCIRSEGGSYVLEEKKGKQVQLVGGQDLASHVGHTVTVHGSFAGAGSAASSPSGASPTSSAGGAGAGGDQFNVTKIDMVSESCDADKDKDHNKADHPQ